MVNQLRKWRKARGLTAQQLANHIEVGSVTTIYRWESGEMAPSVHQVRKIADALGCTIDDLFPAVGLTPGDGASGALAGATDGPVSDQPDEAAS